MNAANAGMGRVGVCSWSLRPADADELVAKVRSCGVQHVQLALDPIRKGEWDAARTWTTLAQAGITIVSGMMGMKGEDYSTLETIRRTGGVRPSEHWQDNLLAVQQTARLAHRFGLRLVTLHAGFLPHESRDPEFKVLIARLVEVVNCFAAFGVTVALETGQETAATLLVALREIERLQPMGNLFGVNFDPANMILYGMGDPVTALRDLSPWVRQIHIKDAMPTAQSGTWGRETPVGAGAVDWPAFFRTMDQQKIRCDLLIEREDGGRRTEDVAAARGLVDRLAPRSAVGPVRMGVIGLGFMGRTHVHAVHAAARHGLAELVAVADCDESRLRADGAVTEGNLPTGAQGLLFDPVKVRTFSDPSALLAMPDLDAVSICTHTQTHVELAIAAMQAGKHVLVEKPVALSSAAVTRVAEASHRARRLCVPAMCMRHWPGWTLLREAAINVSTCSSSQNST